MAAGTTTSGCVPLKMSAQDDGSYATCAQFCSSKCFGRCTPAANCPDSKNNNCATVGKYPDFSGGACCQTARLTNGLHLECNKHLTEEQLNLVNAPISSNRSSPRVEVECCCSDRTCPKPLEDVLPPSAPSPVAAPTTSVAPDDASENIVIPEDIYQKLITRRALLLNTQTPRAPEPMAVPPPVSAIPPIGSVVSQRGSCLVFSPHGCKPGSSNPFNGQSFPPGATKRWTKIASFDPVNSEKIGETDWGKTRCLGSLRTGWHEWCNSSAGEKNMNLQPILAAYCVGDGQCFSDPKCVDDPESCTPTK